MKKSKFHVNILFLVLIISVLYACPNTTKQAGGRNSSSPNHAPDQALIDSIKNSKSGVKSGKIDTTLKSNEHH
jgi:hypothetical protein